MTEAPRESGDGQTSGKSYSQLMGESNAYLTITLDLDDPVEIGDFASLFAGIGGQFDDYIRENHPDLKGRAQMYVREVRRGSIVADLFPNIPDLIEYMDDALIVLAFGALFSKRIRALIGGHHLPDAKKSDLHEIGKTIRAVAHDSGGQMRIESLKFQQGVWVNNLEIEIDTQEARAAEKTIEDQKRALDVVASVDYERVLMTFERSRKSDSTVNKATGELVVIAEVSDKPKALIYASDLAEQKIKHEIHEADDNIYKKGFVVDANARLNNGRVVAYAVTAVHQVIDLPDDDA
ncbi:MAG: hypothetical protein KF810_22950 [Rhizobiaceae bacterium]|nr:hypothetical protein [Rhizobiaceae bacterium]